MILLILKMLLLTLLLGSLFSSPAAHAKPESRGGKERLTLFSKATIGFFGLTFFRRGGKDITRILEKSASLYLFIF